MHHLPQPQRFDAALKVVYHTNILWQTGDTQATVVTFIHPGLSDLKKGLFSLQGLKRRRSFAVKITLVQERLKVKPF